MSDTTTRTYRVTRKVALRNPAFGVTVHRVGDLHEFTDEEAERFRSVMGLELVGAAAAVVGGTEAAPVETGSDTHPLYTMRSHEAQQLVAQATSLEALDALYEAERRHPREARQSVLRAIDARRRALGKAEE